MASKVCTLQKIYHVIRVDDYNFTPNTTNIIYTDEVEDSARKVFFQNIKESKDERFALITEQRIFEVLDCYTKSDVNFDC